MKTREIISVASNYLGQIPGHTFDLLSLSKPKTTESARNLIKIISKLSPLVGNMIEFNIVEFLNEHPDLKKLGKWKRQDPGFPDAIFESNLEEPAPGFEIKAWLPLSTEITARFKDSQNYFLEDQVYVVILAWIPEFVIYGQPKIIDLLIVSGASIARSRDDHYHNPPDYIVLEPEDTSLRTPNLQQTNTNGYKFQHERGRFAQAEKRVRSWGKDGKGYKPTPEYQELVRSLRQDYSYRLDTNFAKIDRINNQSIEAFKQRVHETQYKGMTLLEWNKLLSGGREKDIASALEKHLGIK